MEWSGVEWSGVEWSGVEWSAVEWSGVEWSDQHFNCNGIFLYPQCLLKSAYGMFFIYTSVSFIQTAKTCFLLKQSEPISGPGVFFN